MNRNVDDGENDLVQRRATNSTSSVPTNQPISIEIGAFVISANPILRLLFVKQMQIDGLFQAHMAPPGCRTVAFIQPTARRDMCDALR